MIQLCACCELAALDCVVRMQYTQEFWEESGLIGLHAVACVLDKHSGSWASASPDMPQAPGRPLSELVVPIHALALWLYYGMCISGIIQCCPKEYVTSCAATRTALSAG
mmetsp:Transcript_5109/g.11117  ORF Transcript_5109/g.11117 Transcript_5109/m.11117 type:complete len:109 (+) Transcript_5109:1100-1426(+)